MYTFDHDIFLALNFDGGEVMDAVMRTLTSPVGWTPLFLVLLYMLWRRGGWQELLMFALVLGVACFLADTIASIGKHNGLIGSWFHPFDARLRPMWEPELQGMVHYLPTDEGLPPGGYNGTVSGHAANFISIAIVAAWFVRRRWMTVLLTLMVVVVCYTRIYLGYHYPVDLALGLVAGALASWFALWLFKRACGRYPNLRKSRV